MDFAAQFRTEGLVQPDFDGYYRTPNRVKPLIADDRVRDTLWDQDWPLWSGAVDYLGYLLLLEVAADWTRQLGWKYDKVHVVEFALFTEAKAIRERWRNDSDELRNSLREKYAA